MNEKKMIFRLKILLDVVMLAVLVTLYNKRAISMSFHEVGGLCVFALFLIHNLLNINWIKNVTKKIFSKTISGRLRFQWIVNVSLLLSFLLIIITGLMINKTLPVRISGFANAKQIHYFAAAVSIILMGVHLGLHADMFSALLKKVSFIPAKAVTAFLCVFLAASLIWGGYKIATGSFVRWLSAPFSAAEMGGHEMRDHEEVTSENIPVTGNSKMPEKMDGMKSQYGNEGDNVLKVMAEFGSEIILFAFVTVLISKVKYKSKAT